MDKFDELTNSEIREQLKVNGLGNFPVTDTTRNLLIKKLRNAINGPPTKATKGRRETISVVVNNTSPEESELLAEIKKPKTKALSNRRTTIAAAAAPKINANNTTNGKIILHQNILLRKKIFNHFITIGNSTNGDNVKATAARPKSPSRKSVALKTVENAQLKYFADNSDDDLVAAVEAAERARKSRSPSLSKSSVVTTSYKHTIEPLMELNDDVVLLDDESDDEYDSNMLANVRKATPTTKITAPADSRRKTMQLQPSITTTTNTPKPVELYTATHESTNSYRRRYTTNTPIVNRGQTTNAAGTASADSDEDILNRVQTPFLSDFTRRLAELKATPLAGLDDVNDYKEPKSLSSTYYRSSVYGIDRPVGVIRERSLASKQQKSMSAWNVFENKIRWPLLILLALFIIVFVYVFLFSNY